MTNDQRLPFVASTTRMGWPTQACFWLEWGCSDLPILSSRPEQITARAMICGVESLHCFAEAPSEAEGEVEGDPVPNVCI